ncbi:hypothetical protein BH10ACT3_BH10ACT3_01790 [soil metagenome]
MTRPRLIKSILVGVLAGFVAGLFGVGGGILMVPALVMVMQMDQRTAHGTSLAAVVPIGIASTLSYALAGEVDWAVGACLAVGAVGGAVLGTHLLRFLPQRVLGFAFSALLLLTAARMIFDNSNASGRAALSVMTAVVLVLVGALAGIVAGLLGVGGGIIMVPVMVVGFDMTSVLAKGTSLAVIVPTAIMGTWRNLKNGNADLQVAVASGLAGVVSRLLGAKLSILMPEQLATALFAALLVVVAARMLWQLWRDRDAPPADDVGIEDSNVTS